MSPRDALSPRLAGDERRQFTGSIIVALGQSPAACRLRHPGGHSQPRSDNVDERVVRGGLGLGSLARRSQACRRSSRNGMAVFAARQSVRGPLTAPRRHRRRSIAAQGSPSGKVRNPLSFRARCRARDAGQRKHHRSRRCRNFAKSRLGAVKCRRSPVGSCKRVLRIRRLFRTRGAACHGASLCHVYFRASPQSICIHFACLCTCAPS